MEPFGEELMYDGMGGKMIPTQMFLGNVYTMRLKHMPEDKWNARGEGRREQRTHAPTGGRGAQGGLRIGEMERDAILGHGIADFMRESLMKRADGYQTVVCNGCGTIPIHNERERMFICPMCDGPVRYIGDSATTLDILPPTKRSVASFSRVEMPYAVKLLDQEMNTYLNMGMRFLTTKDVKKFRPPPFSELTGDQEAALLGAALPERVLPETAILEYLPQPEEPEVRPEDLAALGATEEKEAAAASAPVAAPVPVPAPTTNQQDGVVMKIGNMNIGMQQPQQQPVEEEDDISFVQQKEGESMPGEEEKQPPQQQPQPPQQQGGGGQNQGIHVQTSSQPVLVIPLNVNKQPEPTQVIPAPAPGAPQTIAVDTSPSAMQGIGAAPPPRNNTSQKNRRAGPPQGAVSVNKVGGAAPPPAANVRVTVNKTG
jgi:hypothetical protein